MLPALKLRNTSNSNPAVNVCSVHPFGTITCKISDITLSWLNVVGSECYICFMLYIDIMS